MIDGPDWFGFLIRVCPGVCQCIDECKLLLLKNLVAFPKLCNISTYSIHVGFDLKDIKHANIVICNRNKNSKLLIKISTYIFIILLIENLVGCHSIALCIHVHPIDLKKCTIHAKIESMKPLIFGNNCIFTMLMTQAFNAGLNFVSNNTADR